MRDGTGAERPIHRRSTPFGTATEQGLLFVAFSAERDRFEAMLGQMYGIDATGLEDRLLSFSTASSGSYHFAPSVSELHALGLG